MAPRADSFVAQQQLPAVGSLMEEGFFLIRSVLFTLCPLWRLFIQFDFYSAIVQIDELFCLMAVSSRDQFSIM